MLTYMGCLYVFVSLYMQTEPFASLLFSLSTEASYTASVPQIHCHLSSFQISHASSI